MKSLGI